MIWHWRIPPHRPAWARCNCWYGVLFALALCWASNCVAWCYRREADSQALDKAMPWALLIGAQCWSAQLAHCH